MARVYESLVLLCLLAILVFGLAWVALALIDKDTSSRKALWHVWSFYLPLLYSFISLLGVLMLLICTPVGFARLFTVMGQLVVKPQFLQDIEEEINTARFEEETLHRKLQYKVRHTIANGTNSVQEIEEKLTEVQEDRRKLEKRKKVSALRRNLGYPLMMILLLALTAVSVLIVVQNSIELLLGGKELPVGKKDTVLGKSSLVALGPIGAAFEIVLILYFMLASVVGFYSLPVFSRLRPLLHDTTITKIIGNCVVLLVLSSALPVLSRALGITNFDLLGDFGKIDWLGNMEIILTYNLIFGVATSLCLVKKFTLSIRQEIYRRLGMAFRREQKRTTSLNINGSAVKDQSHPSNGFTSPNNGTNGTIQLSSTITMNGNTTHDKNE
ncbi:unnamed protein product [Owenia fusiformis]|uniref:Uncharacterized protein n=1 Tax=Owenia fusiformis TaxID=6347 RepID=A0A8J1XYL5_OWEFU|nr:unnamed protein product [Owenia fusiformis]